MTIKLFVRPIPPLHTQRLEWALYSFGGERIGSGEADQEELKELVNQHNLQDVLVHFIVPANDFSHCIARIPAKQSRYVRQALPYVIEENIAEDIESMHLVIGERLSKEEYPVLLISKDRMQKWYDQASGLGFPLFGIFVDAQLIGNEAATINAVFDGDEVLIHEGNTSVLRIDYRNLIPYLELQANASDEEKTLKMLIHEDQKDRFQVTMAQLEHIDHITPTFETYQVSTFELLCASFFQGASLDNLCQGEFALYTGSVDSGLRRWWPVAAVATLWFVIQIGIDITQVMLYQQQAEDYRNQSVALYKTIFPAEKMIANPKRQLEGKLINAADVGASAGFLPLLAEAGYQMSRLPNKAKMAFNNLQFSDQRGELAMEVRAPSLDDLDRYKRSLVQQGYQVGIGSAIREQGYVRGKLTLKGGT